MALYHQRQLMYVCQQVRQRSTRLKSGAQNESSAVAFGGQVTCGTLCRYQLDGIVGRQSGLRGFEL